MSLDDSARARSAWLREHLTHDRILQIHSQTLEFTFSLQNIRHEFAENIFYGSYSLGLASAMACGHLFVHGRWRNAMIGAGLVGTLVGAALMVQARKFWMQALRHPRQILSGAWLPKNRQVTLTLFRFLGDADDKQIDREPLADPSDNGVEDRVDPQSSHLPNIYSSLSPLVGEIRILEIEPGTFNADIKCRMRAWPANGEGYTALSYVWGNDPPTKSISVNGKSVPIRKNLDNAIRYIRGENEPLRLWVDAICINQQDLSERTSQVGMMSEIYQQAQSLTVFLGEGDDDLSVLFTFIQDINDDMAIDQVLEQADTPRVLDQFWKLLQMPWWSRIWIIQEFAYADASPTFVYGHRKFSASWLWYGFGVLRDKLLQDLYYFAQLSDGNSQMDDSALPLWRGAGSVIQGLHILRSRQQLFHWRHRPVPATHKVSELLKDTQFYHATEPQDRLFGLHSLMMDPVRAFFLPDYHRSIRAVNIRMAAYLFCIEGWTEMYNYFPTTADATLPSWVPDFSTNRERDKWSRIWDSSPLLCVGELECWAEEAILGIRGTDCGTVTEIMSLDWKGNDMEVPPQDSSAALGHSCSESGLHDANSVEILSRILADTKPKRRLPTTEAELEDWNSHSSSRWLGFAKFMPGLDRLSAFDTDFAEFSDSMKLLKGRFTKNDYRLLDLGRLKFRADLTAPTIEKRLRKMREWKESSIDEAWREMKTQLGKRSDLWPDEHFQGFIFTTDTGFTGLCPLQTQIGDKLVVLFGMPTPFLARADESDGKYVLIGPVRATTETLERIKEETKKGSNGEEILYFK